MIQWKKPASAATAMPAKGQRLDGAFPEFDEGADLAACRAGPA